MLRKEEVLEKGVFDHFLLIFLLLRVALASFLTFFVVFSFV